MRLRRRRLQLENLETRIALAGDVTAAVTGDGDLRIDGDDAANQVLVTQIDDDYLVLGIETRIEDADFDFSLGGLDVYGKLLSGVHDDVRVYLNGGDDAFLMGGRIEGLSVDSIDDLGDLDADDLSSIDFGSAIVDEDLIVFGHGGDDLLVIAGTDIRDDAIINGGEGDNIVAIGGGGAVVGVVDLLGDVFLDGAVVDGLLAGIFDVNLPIGSGSVQEVEDNNSIGGAQELEGSDFSLNFDPRFADSTTVPHTTVWGTGDGTFDYYSFEVGNAGDVGTFKTIDTNFDTELFLYDSSGNLLEQDDDGGTGLNSFIIHEFDAPGTYVIGVGEFNSSGSPGGITGNAPDGGDSYGLAISIENSRLDAVIDGVNAILGDVTIGDVLNVKTYTGDDRIYAGGLEVEHSTVINTLRGEDTIFVGVGASIGVFNPWIGDAAIALDGHGGHGGHGGGGLRGLLNRIEVNADADIGTNLVINSGGHDDEIRLGGSIGAALPLFPSDGGMMKPDSEGLIADEGSYGFFPGFFFQVPGGLDVGIDAIVNASTGYDDIFVAVDQASGFLAYGGGDWIGDSEWFGGGQRFNVEIGDDLHINASAGNDYVQIGGVEFGPVFFPTLALEEAGPARYGRGFEGSLRTGGNLHITTANGHDTVVMGGTPFGLGSLGAEVVEIGKGDYIHATAIYDIVVGVDLIINTGLHNDDVLISNSRLIGGGLVEQVPYFYGFLSVGDDAIIDTGAGHDDVTLGGLGVFDGVGDGGGSLADIVIGDDLVIRTDAGHDDVAISAVAVRDNATITTGDGYDDVVLGFDPWFEDSFGPGPGRGGMDVGARLYVHTGLLNDDLYLSHVRVGTDLSLHAGTGDDEVGLRRVSVRDDLFSDLGAGDDSMYMDDVYAADLLRVIASSGDDHVHLYGIAADRLLALMGGGDDDLCVVDSYVDHAATLRGGAGHDRLGLDSNDFGRLVKSSFEGDLDCDE